MEIRKVLALRGPNYWARFPVLEAWVDLAELKDSASDEIPGFNDRLMGWLPTMIEHRCSVGTRGGFFERLRRGTYLAHILEHVTLELQELAWKPVGFGRARETEEEGVYKVAFRYHDEVLGLECLQTGFNLCLAAVHDRPFDVEAEVTRLRALADARCLGPSTTALLEAARARSIPTRQLNSESLFQLGYGIHQRRILTAETDRTSLVAQTISQNRELTHTLLRAVGVPVPDVRPVSSSEEAWAAAQELGLPVVIKPKHGHHGRSVSLHLTTPEQVNAAFDLAAQAGKGVLVEKFQPGHEYRVLVVGDRVVAASRREPPQVVGDGRSTIVELLEQVNHDPSRGDGYRTPLRTIILDQAVQTLLAEQGFTPESVPPAGQRVLLLRQVHFNAGGSATDVTESVHPDVARGAVAAAQVVGLDIAGLDIIAEDLTRPLEEQGGVILGVNAGPGLQMHLPPAAPPQPVGEAILEHLFPGGSDGRVPLVAVTGVNGKTTTTRLIAHILRQTGQTVGMTTTDGIYINERRIHVGDCSGPRSATEVLVNPVVEAAVLEVARGGILREGLGFDRCQVGVVTNIGEGDHLGLSGIETLEALARLKGTVVDVVLPGGTAVLKADDPLVVPMAETCRGAVAYFARDPDHPVLAEHRARGGRTAFVRDEAVVLAEGDREQTLLPLSRAPLTLGGRVGFQVENVLTAALATWALGVPVRAIREGVETFPGGMNQTPGRFNVLEVDGSAVIVDFGHNPSAVAALIEAVDQFPHSRRTAVFSGTGDRKDEDIIRQAELLGGAFDRIILYEAEKLLRGRAPGEILSLLHRGLTSPTRTTEVIEAPGELAAIAAGIDTLPSGELLLIQVDAVEADLAFLRERLSANRPDPEAAKA